MCFGQKWQSLNSNVEPLLLLNLSWSTHCTSIGEWFSWQTKKPVTTFFFSRIALSASSRRRPGVYFSPVFLLLSVFVCGKRACKSELFLQDSILLRRFCHPAYSRSLDWQDSQDLSLNSCIQWPHVIRHTFTRYATNWLPTAPRSTAIPVLIN